MLVKICGLRSQHAMNAAAQGAQMCGFIFVPASPRGISPAEAARLHSHTMLRVGVFVDDDCKAIMQAVRVARLDAVQLHGSQSQATAQKLKNLCSGTNTGQKLQILRVLWPECYTNLHSLEAYLAVHAPHCDYFLLDAGAQGGGSGLALPWEALQGLQSPRPWILAGGLHGDNVRQAIKACSPHGVDLNSGLEHTTGHKDARKIAAALEAIKGYCHE